MVMIMRHGRLSAPSEPPPTAGLSVPPPTAGVLTGVTRTAYSGPTTITTNGTVISNKNLTTSFYVAANNVTFSNCFLDNQDVWGIEVDSGKTGLTIDHCTIRGNGGGQGGVLINNGSVTNCDVLRWENGIMFNGSNARVEGCYIHDLGIRLWLNSTVYAVGVEAHDGVTNGLYICNVAHTSIAAPSTFAQDRAAHPSYWSFSDPHVDGIQCAGDDNFIVRNNWIESWDTSCLIVKADFVGINNFLIEGNTLICDPTRTFGYSASIIARSVGSNLTRDVRILNNRIERSGGYYNLDSPVPASITITGNIDYYTGLPANSN